MASLGGLEVAKGVADFGGALVVLGVYGVAQGALESFPSGERAPGANFFEPAFERLHFAAHLSQLREGMLTLERPDVLQAFFNVLDCHCIVIGFERLRGPGAGEDHQELGPELLEGPGQDLVLGVFADEVKDGQVAFGIAYHGGVIFEVEQADVAMMVLQGFELELGAIFGL